MPPLFELDSTWQAVLQEELKEPYIASLAAFVERERSGNIPIYPPSELVFNALRYTPFNRVRVVIMGQDPYHGPGQAHGLCFSVPKRIAPPPSLQNIFKELASDVGLPTPSHGCLTRWAAQGVLLLNATLTVRQGEPLSHHGQGWERFTDAVVRQLWARPDPLIFVLWGKSAKDKCTRLNAGHKRHVVLTAPHPSPLSAHQGFFGCRHFSRVNELLVQQGHSPIDWQVD